MFSFDDVITTWESRYWWTIKGLRLSPSVWNMVYQRNVFEIISIQWDNELSISILVGVVPTDEQLNKISWNDPIPESFGMLSNRNVDGTLNGILKIITERWMNTEPWGMGPKKLATGPKMEKFLDTQPASTSITFEINLMKTFSVNFWKPQTWHIFSTAVGRLFDHGSENTLWPFT